MDTHGLLFISKSHTGTLSPHQHPGGLGQPCNNPNFHGALLCFYSSCAPRGVPKPVPKCTFLHQKAEMSHQLPARKDPEHQWKELTEEALLAHSPAFPPSGIRKEVLQLGQELFDIKAQFRSLFSAGSREGALPAIFCCCTANKLLVYIPPSLQLSLGFIYIN